MKAYNPLMNRFEECPNPVTVDAGNGSTMAFGPFGEYGPYPHDKAICVGYYAGFGATAPGIYIGWPLVGSREYPMGPGPAFVVDPVGACK